ncbi:MAG: class I mannose-6-phosphate isomerase [Clostridiales bacterium]|jgi:mannose-6-phosphate isomerase|nr:class I mannose-6-phosphate isomerase [Clostridiales bacterium]
MYPLKLKPAVSSTIWGGRRLIDEYSIKTDKCNAAEAWVLSCHPSGQSVVENGELAGTPLGEIFARDKSICGTNAARFSEFPILIKLIDARDNLSIQVHPQEEYARRVEQQAGKTECWYILDCDEGAELIVGFKENITSEQFKKAIEDDTLLDFVRKIKVKKGDFFFIEAGTLHAICKGILLVEVQQNSNTTYRVYDYNRVGADGKPRALHIEKSVAVTNTIPYKPRNEDSCKAHELYKKNKKMLTSCELFTVCTYEVDGEFRSFAGEKSFVSLLALEGSGEVRCAGTKLRLNKGESIFIPAESGEIIISGRLNILETEI